MIKRADLKKGDIITSSTELFVILEINNKGENFYGYFLKGRAGTPCFSNGYLVKYHEKWLLKLNK